MKHLARFATTLSVVLIVLLVGAGVALGSGQPGDPPLALRQSGDAGVFGRSPTDWEDDGYVRMGDLNGYTVFEAEGDSGFAYYVGFDGNVTVLAEIVLLDGTATPRQLETFVTENWLPQDAQKIDEFAGVLVDPDSPRMMVQLYYSDTLYQQGLAPSGTVLVTYGGPDDDQFDRVSVAIGT